MATGLLAAALVSLPSVATSSVTHPGPPAGYCGGLVAVAAPAGLAADLITVDPDVGEPVPFFASPEPDWDPVWSPDGRTLAFSWRPNVPGSQVDPSTFRRIATLDASGDPTSLRVVSSSPFFFSRYPAWSPDGTKIAYVSTPTGTSSDRRLRVIDLTTGQDREVASSGDPGVALDWPQWSQDGQSLLATRVDVAEQDYRLVAVAVSTGVVSELTDDGLSGYGVELPGDRLLFERDVVSGDQLVGSQLWMGRVEDGAVRPVRVVADVPDRFSSRPSLSDRGNRMVWRTRSSTPGVPEQLWVARLNGAGAQPLLPGVPTTGAPSWQPSGPCGR